jgi:hypothetical protein
MIDLKKIDHFGRGARAGGRSAARPAVKAEVAFRPLAGSGPRFCFLASL